MKNFTILVLLFVLLQSVVTISATAPPFATTLAATNIAATSAILNGSVTPNTSSFPCSVTFDYGTSTSYGTTVVATPNNFSGYSSVPVSFNITGLKANTTYHYRVHAMGMEEEAIGADMTFTTSAAAPTITSFSPASGVVGTTVSITGTNFNTTPANNIVFFGATMANVSEATATSLKVTVPSGATYAPISVLNTITALSVHSPTCFTPTFSPAKSNIESSDFTPQVDFSAGASTGPNSIKTSDIDGDGKPDLITANSNNSSISVLQNIGNGGSINFSSPFIFSTSAGGTPSSLAIGDLDADGKNDIVCSDFNAFSLSLFRNTSNINNISFAASIGLATGIYPSSVSINDIDGDGKLDIVTTNFGTNSLSIFQNISSPGNLSFTKISDISTGSLYGPRIISFGDIDGDYKPDMVVGYPNINTISIFRNISTVDNFSFEVKKDIVLNGYTILTDISLCDLDGDNKSEIITVNYTKNGCITLFLNNSSPGNINIGGQLDFPINYPYSLSTYDVNGDSKVDLIFSNFNSLNHSDLVSVLQNKSTLGVLDFGDKVDYPFSFTSHVTAGDLNDDGKPELIGCDVSTNINHKVSVLQNIMNYFPIISGVSFSTFVTSTEATLNSNVNANYSSTTVTFEYGLTTDYGSTVTADQSPVTETTETAVSSTLTELTPYTTYHFRVKAVNSAGTKYGDDQTFKTLGLIPTITSFTPNSGLIGSSATITGTNFNTSIADNEVYIGSTKATIIACTTTSITFTIPVGAVSGKIKVVLNSGGEALSNSDFVVIVAPTITGIPVTSVGYNQAYNYYVTTNTGGDLSTTITAPILPAWLTKKGENIGKAESIGNIPPYVIITAVTVDNDGNTYAISMATESNPSKIYKITPDGTTSIWKSDIEPLMVFDLHIANGYIYIPRMDDKVNSITRIPLNNPDDGEEKFTSLKKGAVALTEKDGWIYASDFISDEIVRINETSGDKETYLTSSDGLPSEGPLGLCFDPNGNLYIASYSNKSILKYNGSTLSTVLSGLPNPVTSVKVDKLGDFYVAFEGGGLRKYKSDFSDYELVSLTASENIYGLSMTETGAIMYSNITNFVYRIEPYVSLQGTPGKSNIGPNHVVLRATNSAGYTEQAFTINVVDNVSPVISAFSPATTGTDVALKPTLSITFDEEVSLGTSGILGIYDGTTLVKSYDLSAPADKALFSLSSDKKTVSVTLTDNLSVNILLSVGLDAGFVKDNYNNSFEGFTAASNTWQFTTINKATPVITWSNPAGITYGTLLSATQLNATADVAGTFVYTPPIGTKLDAGAAQNLKVDFTPTDAANYTTATNTVTITVAKATPVITWSNPPDIDNQTALSGIQLNATSDIEGLFTYTPSSGTILNIGTAQNLKVDFTPTDVTNYNTVSKTVTINIYNGTDVAEINTKNIIIYPNPTENAFQVSGIEGKVTLTLIDLAGKEIFMQEISANDYVYVNTLPDAVYIVKIKSSKGIILKKLYKK